METVKNVFNQIKEQIQKLSAKTRKTLLVLLAVVVALSVVIAVILNNAPYVSLFSDLTAAEATEITAKMTELGMTSFRVEDGGTSIRVPKDQELQLRAQLVSEGYPKGRFTYDTFLNNNGLTTTTFDKNQNLLIDLQERMAESIRFLDIGVEDAVVTITPGSEQRYVLEEDRVAVTASVIVRMRSGGSPSAEQVNGIQRIVAGGVAGLEPANVAVVDGNGTDVSASGDTTTQLGATQFKMRLEREIESATQAKVAKMLDPFYGEGNVRVAATATVNIDQVLREITTYIPSEDNKGVVSNEARSQEIVRDGAAEGGVAGTETNAEVPTYPNTATDGTEQLFRSDEEINYYVSQMKEQVQSDAGKLTDLTLAVAIAGEQESVERVGDLRNLIANTAGITPELMDTKISILYDMYTEGDPGTAEEPPAELIFGFTLEELILIGAGVLVFLIIIIMILTMVGKGKKYRAEEQMRMDAAFEAPQPDLLTTDLKNIPTTRQGELRDQIGDFTDENPEISAQLIRTWLRGVEEE